MHAIFTYIWLKVIVNVGKYTIHGSYGIVRSLIEINSSKHCRHLPDTLIHHSSSDVWMSGCLLGCFPVGESESAPPFRNLFALHLISLFWQVRVGTLVVRNRWTHHKPPGEKPWRLCLAQDICWCVWPQFVFYTCRSRMTHLNVRTCPGSGAMHCSLKWVHLQARKLTFWTPKLVVFVDVSPFRSGLFSSSTSFFWGCNLLRQGFL